MSGVVQHRVHGHLKCRAPGAAKAPCDQVVWSHIIQACVSGNGWRDLTGAVLGLQGKGDCGAGLQHHSRAHQHRATPPGPGQVAGHTAGKAFQISAHNTHPYSCKVYAHSMFFLALSEKFQAACRETPLCCGADPHPCQHAVHCGLY